MKTMNPRLRNIILLLITVLFTTICTVKLIHLQTGKYSVKQSGFHKIDSVQLLGRAFSIGSNKNLRIEFKDTKGRDFVLPSEVVDALSSRYCYDTLQYSGLAMTIYTNAEGIRNSTKPNRSTIEVWNMAIDGKTQVSIDVLNQNLYARAQLGAIIWVLIACCFAYAFM